MVEFHTAQTSAEVASALSQLSSDEPMVISRYGQEHLLALLASARDLAADFDGTLTAGSQWVEIQRFLPEHLLAGEHRDRDWYYGQVADADAPIVPIIDPDWFHGHMLPGNMTAVEGAWIARSASRYIAAELTRDHVARAGQAIIMRDGAPELFALMRHRVIITFGIEDIVQAFLAHNDLQAAVAATRLEFGADDRIIGYDRNVVVSTTKAAAANRFRQLIGSPPHWVLSVGDSVVDIHMMPINGFNVLIVPPGEANRKLAAFRMNHLGVMWDKLTMILVSDSLSPLNEMIRLSRSAS